MKQETNFDEIIKYDVTEAVINGLKDRYLHVKVNGVDDQLNYQIAKEGHIQIKSLKADIEARRKELKADSLTFGKMVDTKARQVLAPILEVEEHLIQQRNVVELELKRIKEEKEMAEQEKVEERVSAFAKYGQVLSFVDARNWSQPTYETQLELLKFNFEAQEKVRLANEESRRLYEEEMARKNIEIEQREREIKRKEKELFDAQAQENKRLKDEIEAKAKLELEAKLEAEKARAVALEESEDQALMQNIMEVYPTLQLCWDELFRLKKNDLEVF